MTLNLQDESGSAVMFELHMPNQGGINAHLIVLGASMLRWSIMNRLVSRHCPRREELGSVQGPRSLYSNSSPQGQAEQN
jgi:hypothetical protein